jgi:hypothetical protein
MWQLICHHTYKYKGCAVDLSPFHNDGTKSDSTKYLADGRASGDGSLRFENQTDRVTVGANSSLTNLGAIKVAAVARIDAGMASVRILAHGDQSFAFGLDADCFLMARIYGASSFCKSSHPLPTQRWINLGMTFDGIGSLEVSIDGELAGDVSVGAGLGDIAGRGLAIGNAHDHPNGGPLWGEIDDIQFWRYHPNSILDQFCTRPIDEATAQCWMALLIGIRRALALDPQCGQALRAQIKTVLDRALRAAVGLPPPQRQELIGLLQNYLSLWSSGDLSGDMEGLLKKLAALLTAGGFNPITDPDATALANSSCLRKIQAMSTGLDCDTYFAKLLRIVDRAFSVSNSVAGRR